MTVNEHFTGVVLEMSFLLYSTLMSFYDDDDDGN